MVVEMAVAISSTTVYNVSRAVLRSMVFNWNLSLPRKQVSVIRTLLLYVLVLSCPILAFLKYRSFPRNVWISFRNSVCNCGGMKFGRITYR